MTVGPISDQNNQTLTFLRNDDFEKATYSSCLALRYQRALLLDDTSTSESHDSDTETSSQRLDDCMVVSQELIGYGSSSSHSFIYRHGIPIPSTMTDDKIISAILVFNAALAYQLSAMSQRGTPNAAISLAKAKQIYELIFRCGEHISLNDNVLFQFALINNIAVITREQGNVAEANRLFDCLMTLLDSESGR